MIRVNSESTRFELIFTVCNPDKSGTPFSKHSLGKLFALSLPACVRTNVGSR